MTDDQTPVQINTGQHLLRAVVESTSHNVEGISFHLFSVRSDEGKQVLVLGIIGRGMTDSEKSFALKLALTFSALCPKPKMPICCCLIVFIEERKINIWDGSYKQDIYKRSYIQDCPIVV
jgi:hypothetical protein